MNRLNPNTSDAPPQRTGATLVEVLMALLIMAVGVTSVFTLFPLAIIKAVKANQLTNAKLFEGSIKDHLLSSSQLWTGAPEWSEDTVYGSRPATDPLQDRWVTPKTSGRLVPDTNELMFCAASNAYPSGSAAPNFQILRSWNAVINAGGYQNFYAMNPPWMLNANDGNLDWTPYRHSPYSANPLWSAYVVDPLGWHRQAAAADQIQFGRIPTDTSGSSRYLDRIHCQLSTQSADQLYRLQDSWNETVPVTPVTVSVPAAGRVQIDFPNTIDLTGLVTRNRVVLTSTTSPRAVSLPVVNASAIVPGISSLVIDGFLPSGFVADQARIEIQSPARYSWLMAVHSGPRGQYEAQCAVVLNRTFESLDEQGYRAEFCQTEDLNGSGALDGSEDQLWVNGRIDTNTAKVRWIYDVNTDSPRIKEGGYIFDASHGFWYQIQKVEVKEERVNADDSLNPSGLYVRSILKLSDPVQATTGSTLNSDPFTDYLVDGTNDAQAVLIPGIIHVFPFSL